MAGHVPLATSPNPTKSSCNRQEEGDNPTSHRCIYRIRANNEQTFATLMYEPFGVQARLATGKGTYQSSTFAFALQNAIAEVCYDDGIVIAVP